MDSLPAEPAAKPKNTGVRSLSLLQQIFLTQESNQGLLHCRQILYQLSYQGSPKPKVVYANSGIFFFIEIKLIYNVVLVSGVQHSESVIYIHVPLLFQILSPYRLLQNIE